MFFQREVGSPGKRYRVPCARWSLPPGQWPLGREGFLLPRTRASDIPLKVLVTQSCLTLCDPMDCSPSGSSVHGILQARMQKPVSIPSLQGIFQTQGSNPSLPHCRQILYCLSHQGSPAQRVKARKPPSYSSKTKGHLKFLIT